MITQLEKDIRLIMNALILLLPPSTQTHGVINGLERRVKDIELKWVGAGDEDG